MARRSVQEIESFCGWDYLLNLVDKCGWLRDKALISTLFETGGRVSEVLKLKAENFEVKDKFIIVKGMPVLKRYRKTGEYVNEDGKTKWITKKTMGYRTFPIPLKEPLVPYMIEWLDYVKNGQLFRISRVQVYRILRKIDSDIYPHWFRAQRASQLALEYGFDVHDLVEFFDWRDLKTAIHYSRKGWRGLAAKMAL